jgi:hypothetical protein
MISFADRRRVNRARIAVAVVTTGVIAVVAAGCGSNSTHAAAGLSGGSSNGVSAQPTPPSSTTAEPTGTPSTSTTPPPPTAVRPKPSGGAPTGSTGSTGDDVTVTGTVTVGAEPSCLLVSYQKVEYLLLTDNPAIVAGESVRATGHVVEGVRTHCQQGIPFQVTQVKVTSLR